MTIDATLNGDSTESNSSPKTKLIVNTSAFSNEDFNTYLHSCQKIETNEKLRKSQVHHERFFATNASVAASSSILSSSLIKATMTRKEIFECSTLEDDDEANSSPRANLSESISNLLKYFDEDIRVNTSVSSSDNTPVKLPPVASVVEHFKNKAAIFTSTMMTSSPFKQRNRGKDIEVRSKIQELRKKYESTSEQESERVPKIHIQSDLKRNSLVQQITKLFRPTSPKSSPKKRSKRPSYRPQVLPSPVPSPRSQRKHPTLRNNFLEAEEIFHQLSVKDKALLYARLFQGNGNPKDLPQKKKSPTTRRRHSQHKGEIITEPQGSVKHLTQKLEASFANRSTSSTCGESSKNSQLSKNSDVGEQSQKSELSEKSEAREEKVNNDCSSRLESRNAEPRRSEPIQKTLSKSKDDPIEEEPLKVETVSSGSHVAQSDSKELESDSSSIEKLSSDECQLTKPLKSIRKKKVRRHHLWKKNHSNVELTDRVQTTDSDSDCKVVSRVAKSPSSPKEPTIERDPSLEDDKGDKVAFSPLCKNINDLNPETVSEEHMNSTTTTSKPNEVIELQTSPHLMVSYEDQGFETGSNELNTSCRLKPSNTFDCSTPIRGQTPQSLSTTADPPHRDFNFSPIYIKSLSEPSAQSDQKIYSPVSQQVNPEDRLSEKQATSSQDIISTNHATISIVDKNTEKTSVFWVCIGDFAISIDICYNPEERLLCLYDMFSQKTSDAEGPTYFGIGIDDQVFSVTDSLLEQQKTFKRIPLRENCSQYWFAKGDLAVHFTGKFMSPEKAKHLLNFLQQVVTSSTFLPLHFGVDYIDFSKELWGRDMEFLKHSENVRDDCKEHVPCTTQNASCNSSEIKTSDLDHSDFESDECENKDSRRMVTFNLAKSDQREEKSKTFTVKYEGPRSDRKYDDEDLTTSSNHSHSSCPLSHIDIDELKGSAQYFSKLQEIISAIHDISEKTDFTNSSTTELENYAFYLSRYADTCLDTCMKHLDKVLDVLNNRPPTPSN